MLDFIPFRHTVLTNNILQGLCNVRVSKTHPLTAAAVSSSTPAVMASTLAHQAYQHSIHGVSAPKRLQQCAIVPYGPPRLLLSKPSQHTHLRLWRQQATDSTAEAQPAVAAPPEPAEHDEDDPEQQMARLPRPSQHLQPQLSGKERAALRSQSEQLAKAKTLQRVQVGGKGVSLNVLITIMDILVKYQFVRVKLGEGCGLERKQTAAQLAQLLDAAVVGQVGFTITLYRQKGLPRPDSLSKPGQE